MLKLFWWKERYNEIAVEGHWLHHPATDVGE